MNKPTPGSLKGIVKRGERFRVGKVNGNQVLYFALGPIPHWSSFSPFTWIGTFTQARKLVKQIGGGIYPVEAKP